MKFPFVLAFPQAHALLLTVKQLELLSCICGFCCINPRQSGYHQRPLKLKASGALAAARGGDSRGPGLLITSVTALFSYHDSFWADSRCPGEEKGLFLTHTEALSRLTEGLKQWTLVTWSSLLLKRPLLQIQIVFPLAYNYSPLRLGFSSGSDSKESVCNAGWVWSLSQEDPLEKGVATHSSTLAWEFHGERSFMGYSPWGCKESDTAKWLTLSLLSD